MCEDNAHRTVDFFFTVSNKQAQTGKLPAVVKQASEKLSDYVGGGDIGH